MINSTCANMSSRAHASGNCIFTCVHLTISRMVYKLVGRQLSIAVCRCKWLQGHIYGTSCLTRHVPVWHLIVLSLVSFQVKLTGTLPDHEASGNPIEATLSGLLCVRHSASHFVSTGVNRRAWMFY